MRLIVILCLVISVSMAGEKKTIKKGATPSPKAKTIQPLNIAGKRTKKEVLTVIKKQQKSINQIHRHHLKKLPKLNGFVRFRIRINEYGKVLSATVMESGTRYLDYEDELEDYDAELEDFEEELAKQIKSWKFSSKGIKSDVTVVEYSFQFK